MFGNLDMLGAGDGLRDFQLVVRFKGLDAERAKKALADGVLSPTMASAVSTLASSGADYAPRFVLDMARPLIEGQLRKFGVDTEVSVADPKSPASVDGRKSEFLPGAVVGAMATAAVCGVGWAAWKLVFKRLFS